MTLKKMGDANRYKEHDGKRVLLRIGFVLIITMINVPIGALLVMPFEVTTMSLKHLWSSVFGGPSLIGNDGPLPLIVGSIAFIVGLAMAALLNICVAWLTKMVNGGMVAVSPPLTFLIAILSIVLGMTLAAPTVIGRPIFFLN